MSKSIFDVVGQAPDDPILGLNEAFKSDPRDKKVNLSIGVYSTEDGKVPLLRVVAEAEKRILEAGEPHTYLPISGIPAFTSGVQKLILGADSPIIKEKRAVTVQSLGGTGALKVGADFLAAILKDPQAVVSTPTCGPCLGGYMGILAAHERCVSTTNRNFVGRMGDVTSEVYLASPYVAAASAVTGKISGPKDVL